jgi:hypothetical protein
MMLQALQGGFFTVTSYYRIKKWLPFFFADITLFPIKNDRNLNQLVHGIDDDWVCYIPNRLENGDVRRIFNVDTRQQAWRLIDMSEDRAWFVLIARAYNRVGYVQRSPTQWPQEFVKTVLSEHRLEQSRQFAKVVMGAIQLGDSRRRLKKKIFAYLRANVTSPPCSFCRCDYGIVHKNYYCQHIHYYHRHCIEKYIASFQLRLDCPVARCGARLNVLHPSMQMIDLESLGLACNLCGNLFNLGEFYGYTPDCNHVYHQECFSAVPVVYTFRKCYDPECSVYFTVDGVCRKGLTIHQ